MHYYDIGGKGFCREKFYETGKVKVVIHDKEKVKRKKKLLL